MLPRIAFSKDRRLLTLSVMCGLMATALCAGRARADERKFMVMLALSAKSGSSGEADYPAVPAIPPLNFSEVRKVYFDPENDPDILSFREYWAEISYGDVTISGDAFDFINLPWRQYPLGTALPTEPDAERKLQWIDMDDDPSVRNFSYGVGESFREDQRMFQPNRLDLTQPPDYYDFLPALGVRDGVWTPGERFRDVNSSGNYTYIECKHPSTGEGEEQPHSCDDEDDAFDADGNGRFDCPVCSDELGDNPEPFEDFMRIYDPTRPEGERWVILWYSPEDDTNWPLRWGDKFFPWAPDDPDLAPVFTGNPAFRQRYIAFYTAFMSQLADVEVTEYLTQNYPGNATTLLNRTADGVFQGADMWTERNDATNPTTKLYDTGFSEPSHSTPAPSWLGTFWATRYGETAPTWRSDIPRIETFDPANPDPSEVPGDDQQRDFVAMAGPADPGDATLSSFYPADPDVSQGTASVLPDTAEDRPFYDGPVEFDDLASSIYHDNYPDDRCGGPRCAFGPRWTNGDLRLGEVTSPVGFEIWGATSSGLPGPIQSAGPLAYGVDGQFGRDAGNLLNLELLTWRHAAQPTHHFDPGMAIWNSTQYVTELTTNPRTYAQMYSVGFRDFNIDGLIDQGETLPFDTEDTQYSNYAVSVDETVELNGLYPFNRTRMTEDVVAALDPAVNFNQFTAQGGPYAGHIYDTILVTPQGQEPFDAVGREFAPELVPIQTRDGTFWFADLVGSLANMDGDNLDAQNPIKRNYDVTTTAHEYGHAWEGWPDLYDEIGLDPGDVVINDPFGRWDLMSLSAMVHPAPFLKQNIDIGTGQANTGPVARIRMHTPWISPVDLRTVLTPGVPETLNIVPCEFTRTDAFYYFDNVATPELRERFYFWVDSDQGFHKSINLGEGERFPHTGTPGYGLLISHIDLREGGGAFPPQNQDAFGSFWTYNLLQADGLEELEANFELDGVGPNSCTVDPQIIGEPNVGDAGDPFPGCSNRREWNADTLPTSKWHDELESGLQMTDIQSGPDGRSRLVTFLWDPREVPSLSFIRPPGGESVACGPPICSGACEIYRINYRAFDFFGGTKVEFYIDDDDEGYDGTLLEFDLNGDVPGDCSSGATTTLVPKQPGSVVNNVPINVRELANGEYYFYARLLPGPNAQGKTDPSVSDVYPSAANVGNGELIINDGDVDLDSSRVEVWTVFAAAGGGGDVWQVSGTLSGNQSSTYTLGQPSPYVSDGGEISFQILEGSVPFDEGDRFSFLTTGRTAYSRSLKIQNGHVLVGPVALFEAIPATGSEPLTVVFASTSLDPLDDPLTHTWDFGDGSSQSGVELRVVQHEYTDPGDYDATLTVRNPLGQQDSKSVVIRVIPNESPVAVISQPADGSTFDAGDVVHFSAVGSEDPEDGTDVTLEWDFGDGTNPVSGAYDDFDPNGETDHTYAQKCDPCTVRLTVTDQVGAEDTAVITLHILGNTAPVAAFTAVPTSGGAPLVVNFNASASSDVDGDPLTFSWNFGDGPPAGSGAVVQHTYAAIGTYTVVLTVADDRGGVGTTSTLIQVINLPPVVNLVVNPASGSPPVTVSFDASGSFDPEGGPLSFSWIFGDGATDTTSGAMVSHTYGAVGSFTARLTVTDNKGAGVTQLRSIIVTAPGNRPPAVSLAASPTSGSAPLNVNFDLSGTSDPDGDPVLLTIDFGDGQVLVNVLPTSMIGHAYTNAGTYTAMVVGTDGKGAAAQTEAVITVSGPAPSPSPTPGGLGCGVGLVEAALVSVLGLLLLSAGNGRLRRRR